MSEEDYAEKVIVSFDFWLKQSAEDPSRVLDTEGTENLHDRKY
jgi:hypothetical protein